jgi:hypothetical protein
MMETARTSETLVNFYQTTRRYNPEDSNLHTHRRENLKSYLLIDGHIRVALNTFVIRFYDYEKPISYLKV